MDCHYTWPKEVKPQLETDLLDWPKKTEPDKPETGRAATSRR